MPPSLDDVLDASSICKVGIVVKQAGIIRLRVTDPNLYAHNIVSDTFFSDTTIVTVLQFNMRFKWELLGGTIRIPIAKKTSLIYTFV